MRNAVIALLLMAVPTNAYSQDWNVVQDRLRQSLTSIGRRAITTTTTAEILQEMGCTVTFRSERTGEGMRREMRAALPQWYVSQFEQSLEAIEPREAIRNRVTEGITGIEQKIGSRAAACTAFGFILDVLLDIDIEDFRMIAHVLHVTRLD